MLECKCKCLASLFLGFCRRCLWHEKRRNTSCSGYSNFGQRFKKNSSSIYIIFVLLDYLTSSQSIHCYQFLFFERPSVHIVCNSLWLHVKSCLVPQGVVHVSLHWTNLQCVTFAALHLHVVKMFHSSITLKLFVYSCMNQIFSMEELESTSVASNEIRPTDTFIYT